jgi:Flp pilus assembly protein CpaB
VELTGNKYGGSRGVRGLLSTRRGTVLVAGACTLLAAGILLFAAVRYKHSVNAQQQPETVLVATRLIQKGTAGSALSGGGTFRPEQILSKQVSSGAIADAAALTGKVALADIQPGQQLTVADFGSGQPYIAELAPTQRAISIPLDASHGLSGILRAGDRVDVYVGVSVGGTGGSSTGGAVRLLLPDVTVMTVGQNAGGGGVGGGSGANSISDVVLKVSAADAGALAFAADNGKVWLILRGANATEPKQPAQLYTLNSLLLGSKPVSSGGKP